MSEEQSDTLVLMDEEGQEHQFQVLDILEVDGTEYVVLLPTEPGEEDEEEVAEVLRIETDESGEEVLVELDDEAELEKVARAWEESSAEE